jgi:hypothetical protein
VAAAVRVGVGDAGSLLGHARHEEAVEDGPGIGSLAEKHLLRFDGGEVPAEEVDLRRLNLPRRNRLEGRSALALLLPAFGTLLEHARDLLAAVAVLVLI